MLQSDVDLIRGQYGDVLLKHSEDPKVSDNLTLYLVMLSCINRQIALASAMPALFEDRNMYALMTLVRLQLEGLLRLHAFRVVDDRNALAVHFLIEGKELKIYKGKKYGNKLGDSKLGEDLDENGGTGINKMYKFLCSWVHFSNEHFSNLVQPGEDREDGIPNWDLRIGGYKEENWNSVCNQLATTVPFIHEVTAHLVDELLEGMISNDQTIH